MNNRGKTRMNILLYSNCDDQAVNEHLFEPVESKGPRDQVEFLQTMDALRVRVQRLSKKETVSKVTKLFPNFINIMDSDFHLVSDVLEKMLNNKNSAATIWGTYD
jgi:hypothetical protein